MSSSAGPLPAGDSSIFIGRRSGAALWREGLTRRKLTEKINRTRPNTVLHAINTRNAESSVQFLCLLHLFRSLQREWVTERSLTSPMTELDRDEVKRGVHRDKESEPVWKVSSPGFTRGDSGLVNVMPAQCRGGPPQPAGRA